MTKVTFLTALSVFLMSLFSCGKDENMLTPEGIFNVTASELENSHSNVFSYEVVSASGSYTMYVTFQDSTITLLKYTSGADCGFVRNYSYRIEDQTLILSTSDHSDTTITYYGEISKYLAEGQPQLIISHGDTGNLPDELVHCYDYSDTNLYEL